MRRLAMIVVVALSLLAAGCQQQSPEVATDTAMTSPRPAETDTAAVERDVTQIRDQWIAAAERDDAAAVAALYSEEALFDAPDSPTAVTGRQAIQEYFARGFATASNLKVNSTDFEVSGDLAVDYGEYTQQITPPKGKPVEQRGRYVVILKRQDDGGWKIEKHLSFPLTPPPAAPARRG